MDANVPPGFPHRRWDCSWPQLFTERRPFNHWSRKTENVPFIEYLAGIGEEVVEDAADEHHNYDGCDEDDDQVEGQDEAAHGEEDGGHLEYGNEEDDVRRFMIGADDILISRDQVDLVANFCEKSKDNPHLEEARKHVALLDERCLHDAISDRRGLHRPYLGPLTTQQLSERMSRKVSSICALNQNQKECPAHDFNSDSRPTQKIFLTSMYWKMSSMTQLEESCKR